MLFILIAILFINVRAQKTDDCGKNPTWLTEPKTGQKAWDKCIEYQEKYVNPCQKATLAHHRGDQSLITSNIDSPNNYYNYVVSLAEGDKDNINWKCNGVVISERYILTTAYCTLHSNTTFVYLGAAVPSNEIDDMRLHKVKRTIKHPESDEFAFHHDIALLETDDLLTTIKWNHSIRPACLHTGQPLNYEQAIFISRSYWNKNNSDYLLKLNMTMESEASCNATIKAWADYMNIDYEIREPYLCYVDQNNKQSTLRFDTGSPLQVRSEMINCMDTVIGLLSFKTTIDQQVNVFTRISHYVPWIESIVWH